MGRHAAGALPLSLARSACLALEPVKLTVFRSQTGQQPQQYGQPHIQPQPQAYPPKPALS